MTGTTTTVGTEHDYREAARDVMRHDGPCHLDLRSAIARTYLDLADVVAYAEKVECGERERFTADVSAACGHLSAALSAENGEGWREREAATVFVRLAVTAPRLRRRAVDRS
ncbi:hypothetical protein GCM10022243_23870 [Saccharothrix violaceirubra]|uniref:Uncharacterized protein n=1 Tax=Saccharothrix violaceirubra TaxID=413306 RepID=A0A7W7WY47_9PSEU|nr:hypothetical protein [Saccharothrix violaceirubra]MBB4967832.1 hypothetical protein [Saccharothrix violaceirubra]